MINMLGGGGGGGGGTHLNGKGSGRLAINILKSIR